LASLNIPLSDKDCFQMLYVVFWNAKCSVSHTPPKFLPKSVTSPGPTFNAPPLLALEGLVFFSLSTCFIN